MYICPQCGRSYSVEEFMEDRFCPNCGKFLTYQNKRSWILREKSRKRASSIKNSKKQGLQRCPLCGRKLKNLMRHFSVVHNIKNIDQLRDATERKKKVTKKYVVQETLYTPESYWDGVISRQLGKEGDESKSIKMPRARRSKRKWKYEKIIEYIDGCKKPFTSREVADYTGCPVATVTAVFSKIGDDFIIATGKAKYDARLLLYDKTSKWNKDEALSKYRLKPLKTPVSISHIMLEFDKCKKQLNEDLNLSQEVINGTMKLIEEYQPFFDKETEKYETSLPRYLRPEIVIGACLYLACEDRGLGISQFRIARAQGHYDTISLSKTIGDIRANKCARKTHPHEPEQQMRSFKKQKRGQYPKVNCPQCGKEIFLVFPDDPFCSTKCSRKYRKTHTRK